MAIGCGAKCSKVMLIVFNIIFWLSGCAILAVGIWLRVDPNMVSLQKLVSITPEDPTLETAAYVLIGVGAFIFLVGFCGCCGALRESKFMLGVYMGCLVIVMAAELAAGILVAVYKPKVEAGLQAGLLNNLRYNYMPNTTIGTGFDWVQLKFECCGVAGYADYKGSAYSNKTQKVVPLSCCTVKNADSIDLNNPDFKDSAQCMTDAMKAVGQTSTALNTKGCYKGVLGWVKDNLPVVIGVGVGIACLELFGFIFAVCLCRNVGQEE